MISSDHINRDCTSSIGVSLGYSDGSIARSTEAE